jgi:integrase/recombinase XerD
MAWLVGRYSDAYASNQYRALQHFFKWLSAEEDLPDPMAGLRPPGVAGKLVPIFTGAELTLLEHACAGRGFAERRDAAVIAVLRASGIRLSELAGIRYDPHDPRCGDVDVWQREIIVRGKGSRPRIVKIEYDAARVVDRYLRARSRHPQAWRPQLWLGAGGRGPLTASGIYQAVTRRAGSAGWRCGRTGSSITSATPGWSGADRKATTWSSTAGLPRRCSPATAPAPAAPARRAERARRR